METDPVCGMHIHDTKKAPRSRYNGKAYYFCSETCRDAFEGKPAEYARA